MTKYDSMLFMHSAMDIYSPSNFKPISSLNLTLVCQVYSILCVIHTKVNVRYQVSLLTPHNPHGLARCYVLNYNITEPQTSDTYQMHSI